MKKLCWFNLSIKNSRIASRQITLNELQCRSNESTIAWKEFVSEFTAWCRGQTSTGNTRLYNNIAFLIAFFLTSIIEHCWYVNKVNLVSVDFPLLAWGFSADSATWPTEFGLNVHLFVAVTSYNKVTSQLPMVEYLSIFCWASQGWVQPVAGLFFFLDHSEYWDVSSSSVWLGKAFQP